MKTEIYTIAELGKKVAFVSGNRAISKKNLEQKVDSIKECGQLTPLVIVNGEDAHKEGLILSDCETKEIVPTDAISKYVVIIEGQHRFTAIQALKKQDEVKKTSFAPKDVLVMYALNSKEKSVKKLISELNRAAIIWDGKDYITGAALCNPTSELLQYAKELADLKSEDKNSSLPKSGYPVSTISKFVTFGIGLTKEKLAASMEIGTGSLPIDNIARAKKIIEVAINAKFTHKYLSHKYFIDWIIEEQTNKPIEDVYEAISKLSLQEVEQIMKIKGENYISEIRKVIMK